VTSHSSVMGIPLRAIPAFNLFLKKNPIYYNNTICRNKLADE